jgi:ATP synthase protein I
VTDNNPPSETKNDRPLDDEKLSELDKDLAVFQSSYNVPDKISETSQSLRGFGIGYRVGIDVFATLGVSILIGFWLDKWLNTKPWLMLVMCFVGIAAAMKTAYQTLMRAEKQSDSNGQHD